MKRIRFIELELENFTSHRSLTVEYGRITRLSGRNGQGKTSIGTAPVWVLWGTDLSGRKWSPRPVNYDADVTRAALLLEVDGKPIKFERGIDGGDNVFLINDVPTKAKEYEAAVASLFDRDEFLSLYYPPYFFGLHWTDQRKMILRHTVSPAKSEVLAEMSRTSKEQKVTEIPLNPAAKKLAELTQKHSLDELQKIHRDKKVKLEKDHIAAQSRTRTLQEQLTLMDSAPDVDIEEAKVDIAKIDAAIAELERATAGADENNRRIVALQSKVRTLLEQRDRMKQQFAALQSEPIADACRVCKQPLQGDAVEAAKADKERRISEFKAEYDRIVAQRKELEAELAVLEYIDVSEKLEEIRRWQEAKQALQDAIRAKEDRQKLEAQVEQARADEAATLTSLKESIFILDAIKAYRAKEAELQAEKVQSLFTSLSIRLFKYVKTTDEWEPDFAIQMDGKDYALLSAGEKIAAGLELADVLFKKSALITPVFIDGIESYTGHVAVYDQLITGRAVPDQELRIETEGEA